MRLESHQLDVPHHKKMVTGCCWTPSNEVVTCSDDNTIVKWKMDGTVSDQVATVDAFVTSIDWIPSVGKAAADLFVISCTDGTIRILSKNGREEKRVSAVDAGAVIRLRWNHDGSALASAAEDGTVKIWSRSGNLRSTIATTGKSVYTLVWGPDNDQILFSSGRELVIKTIQVGRKQLAWKAHDGVVMTVDWNPINNRIVSGGEDRTYRVWDSFGRQLYQSSPSSHVITSIAWSPSGETFAVGSYNMLRLCDKTGWSYSHEQPSCGSLMDISWSSDGTQLAAAGGNGSALFAQVIERTLEWNNIEVSLVSPTKIRVTDILNESAEDLEFTRDRVVEMSLGHNYLIVATTSQCHIYSVSNFNTPHIFELRAPVNLIIQSESHFCTTDNLNGVQVYSYEGRAVSNPRFNGLRVEYLNHQTISMSSDTISILDRTSGGGGGSNTNNNENNNNSARVIRSFEITTGRALTAGTVSHSLDIVELALNQYGPSTERKLYFIDANRDLYITPVISSSAGLKKKDSSTTVDKKFKLRTQVDSAAWNDTSDQLVALADDKLVSWSYPSIVYVDRDLLPATTVVTDGSGFLKNPEILSYAGSRVTIRRADGAILVTATSPYPAALYLMTADARWESAIRLCRFVKQDELWATLAGMALASRHLDTAEVALAAIDEVDKLAFVLYVKNNVPSREGKEAELALYMRNVDEAEDILLQASPSPLVYRAIKMNIRLFRWERALELAIKFKTHVDTVLAYREAYLKEFKLGPETSERFVTYREQVDVDFEAIAVKKQQEREKEVEMANQGRLSSSRK